MHKINVIGLGYIGLPTCLMFATHGYSVTGIDYNKELVSKLNLGELTFHEKGLEGLFKTAQKSNVRFTSEYEKGTFFIIAVPTPYNKKTKVIDASFVVGAIESVMDICEDNSIIVIESTISPGTIDKFVRPVVNAKEDERSIKVNLVHCPERIIPGNMVYELQNNSRTIGADSEIVAGEVANAYRSFCRGNIAITDIKTAEMTKVVENTYRDINIAFANELSKIAYEAGIDVHEIIRIANMHPRVNILQPGPGVGGHCISVDPWFLVGDYPSIAKLIWQARLVNDSMPLFVAERVCEIAKQFNIPHDRIGFYGLTYKENVDDYRESPTIQLLEHQHSLLCENSKVYDPFVQKQLYPNQYHDFNQFLNEVDLVVIMQPHDHIKENFALLNDKIVFDTKAAFKKSNKVFWL
jgi:UDP-N-acetyl-D-mannosaminuronic acid dehydrogenase